jgi:isoamylase
VRRFIKGDTGVVGDLATRIAGSPDMYAGRGTGASVNFLTAHDGFTLADLVSYNDKHNEANGEDNRDGANDNNSWNHGAEGPTDDPEINALRMRQMKNAMAILLTSQGVPMILAGDEFGRTQRGNNNTYCQDNELSWVDWELANTNAELLRFTRAMIAFRSAHPQLRTHRHTTGMPVPGTGLPDISWHGVTAWEPDWSPESRLLAVMRSGADEDDVVYIAMNAHWEGHDLQLPHLPDGRTWHLFADTGATAPDDLHPLGEEPELVNPGSYLIGPRSVVVLVGRTPSTEGA